MQIRPFRDLAVYINVKNQLVVYLTSTHQSRQWLLNIHSPQLLYKKAHIDGVNWTVPKRPRPSSIHYQKGQAELHPCDHRWGHHLPRPSSAGSSSSCSSSSLHFHPMVYTPAKICPNQTFHVQISALFKLLCWLMLINIRGGGVPVHGPVRQVPAGLQQLVQERGVVWQGRQLHELTQRLLLPHVASRNVY